MAAISSTQSGNWSAASTWIGGVVPGNGDTVTITHAVTVDTDTTFSGGTVSLGGSVIIDTDVTLTTNGATTFGTSTAPKTSYLTFRAGSGFVLGANVALYACSVTTDGTTKANPAIISGTGAITSSSGSGKGRWDCQYLLFKQSGNVQCQWGNTSSSFAFTTYYKFLNCVFGAATFTFGSAAVAVQDMIFNYCDFRESSLVAYFLSNSGVAQMMHTTASATTRKSWTLRSPGIEFDFTGSVFNNVGLSVQTKGGATLKFADVFMAQTSASSGSTMLGVEDDATSGSATYEDSYFYCSTSNLRVLSLGSAATASASGPVHSVSGNVMEIRAYDGGNPIVIGQMKTNIFGNLMIGYVMPWASRAYAVGSTPYGLSVTRNTQFAESGDTAPALVSLEQGETAYPGDITTHSNLTVWSSTPHDSTYASLACERSSIVNDSMTLAGHNAYYNPGTGAKYTYSSLATDLTANDIELVSVPSFVDSTRDLASWGASVGADGTVAGAISLLLTINGYESTGGTQNGSTASVMPADLVSWVRAGYAPTVAALDGAGYGGVDIGAMDYISPDSTAPIISDLSAVATGTTTATLTVTTDEGNGSVFFLLDANATATEAAILAGLSQSVTATGEQTINVSALDASTAYYAHVLHRDAASNVSNILHSAQFTTDEAPPVVYPVVTATASAVSATEVSAMATTTKAGGTISAQLTTSATAPSATTIMADPDDTAVVTDAGAYELSVTGLTFNTQYYWHIVHVDGESLESSVVTVAVRTLDLSITLDFPDTAPCSLLGYQVWSKLTVTDEEITALWSA